MKQNEELTKSLVSLIDETLEELEELKKSKFSAAEIKIEGPGDKELAGKPANGELDAKKAEDDKEDDDDKKEDEVEKGVLDEAEKAEVEKAEEEKEEEKEEKAEKSEEEQDDLQKSEESAEESKEEEIEEDDSLKKSLEEQETLIKSYVDSKFESLEKKVASLTEMIDKLADQPVERKGVPANVQALEKSTEEEDAEPLSKSDVASKLFELKKSGTTVDTADIIRVETGSATDVQAIAEKYNL